MFTLSHPMSYCRHHDLDNLSTIIDREYLQNLKQLLIVK
jgi:hypothetical protein